MNSTATWCTSLLRSRRRRHASYWAGVAVKSMSTGLASRASGGRWRASPVRRARDRRGTCSPSASARSAQRMPGPPALVRMASRGPAGSGWEAKVLPA